MSTTFRALLATQQDGKFGASFQELPVSSLAGHDVLIRVAYSSLNYKDGLAVTGKPGVIRSFPMVPGIDLAGTVEESQSPEFQPGDKVVVTGCGTSETVWGGYAQLARLKAEWIVPLPAGLTLAQAMAVGTAGFTAMQAVMALESRGLRPGGRDVVVTGAGGGVGSVAIAILARLGYRVAASTGRPEIREYLHWLGAQEIIDRAVLATPSKRPMDTERWGGAIDSVGGETLAGLLRTMAAGSAVAACGVAGGAAVNTTVFPFILRGVSLIGIDSVRASNAQRRAVWERVTTDLPLDRLDGLTQVAPLTRVFDLGAEILAGRVRGRTVLDVNA